MLGRTACRLGRYFAFIEPYVRRRAEPCGTRERSEIERALDSLHSMLDGSCLWELAGGLSIGAHLGDFYRSHMDIDIQIAEEELARSVAMYQAEGGTVIVMDPRTFGILAMASLPEYDPGRYYDSYVTSSPPFQDPAISKQYEPGSVFKIVTVAAALDSGLVTPDTFTVDKTDHTVIAREIAEKATMTVRIDGGTEEQPVPVAQRQAPSLNDAQVAELAQLGTQIETLYGMPMDIEWALIPTSPAG